MWPSFLEPPSCHLKSYSPSSPRHSCSSDNLGLCGPLQAKSRALWHSTRDIPERQVSIDLYPWCIWPTTLSYKDLTSDLGKFICAIISCLHLSKETNQVILFILLLFFNLQNLTG